MRRRTLTITAIALLLLPLTACTDTDAEQDGLPTVNDNTRINSMSDYCEGNSVSDVRQCDIPLSDGRTVTCLAIHDNGYEFGVFGVSCDWEHVNDPTKE